MEHRLSVTTWRRNLRHSVSTKNKWTLKLEHQPVVIPPFLTAVKNGGITVDEPESVTREPVELTDRELILFRMLRNGTFGWTRLEQERLPIDFVYEKLRLWVG